MAGGRTHVSELRTYDETLYAVTKDAATKRYQRLLNATWKPDLRPYGESLRDESVVPTPFDENEHVLASQYGGKVDFTVYGAGLDEPADGNLPHTGLGQLVRSAMGGEIAAEDSTVKVAGTTSTTQVEVDDPANFDACSVIGVPTLSGWDGSLKVEPALVRKKVGAVLHLWSTLASVPADGSTVTNFEACYFDKDDYGGNGFSLAMELVGENAEDQWLLKGVIPTEFKIEAAMRQLLKFQFSCQVNNSTMGSGLGLSIDKGAPVDGHALPAVDRFFYFGTNTDADAAIARTILQLEDVTVDPGAETADEGGGGVQTLYRRRLVRARPTADIQFRLTRSSTQLATFQTEYSTHVKKYTHLYWGNTLASNGRGGIVAAFMPRCQYDMHIGRTDADGFVRGNVKLGAMRPRSYTSAPVGLGDSPLIIAFG